MKNKIRLGVNIDHVATVRNARGEDYPSPLKAALLSQKYGADSVTIHLREDRRHIKDKDLKIIRSKLNIPLNLEIASTKEMLKIALKQKPNFICIVPEKRKEITTEGGLNLNYKKNFLIEIIKKLKQNGSRVSLFIEPKITDVIQAKKMNSDCIEIHTGKICNLINKKKPYKKELLKIRRSVNHAKKLGLEVHAGHGLTYNSAKILKRINNINEFNIGHFLIGESIFIGLKESITKFKKIIKQ
jgi:pyridoxine 5-phosphate synthase